MRKFWLRSVFAVGIAGWLGLMGLWLAPVGRVVAAAQGSAPPAALPNEACAGCHKDIYERYQTTPMARASGAAADGFLPGSFKHEASGVQYRMEKTGGRVYLDFERSAAPEVGKSGNEFSGRRELKYFLGSGKRGRTFLFEQDGYWFEIPINWYGKKRIWDMAPNYLNAVEMPLTMPVDPGCLRCHASGAQPSLPEARNKYAGVPFTQGGITCTSCHDGGAGAAAHIASRGRVELEKIDALEPVKRDSVCLSCHLEGEAAVVHAGKRLVDFIPGESVFDYASYFVREATVGGGERATSQWEALLESGCRRGAGAKLTCTSCHDPHGSTAGMKASERVEFYRARCLACHDAPSSRNRGFVPAHPFRDEAAEWMGHRVVSPGLDLISQTRDVGHTAQAAGGFGESHHPENRDCAACHMPRANSNDIAHEQVTDHSIPAIPRIARSVGAVGSDPAVGKLVPVGDGGVGKSDVSDSRDLGLAYAMSAVKGNRVGDRAAGERAMLLLKEAESNPGASQDSELHRQLGFLEQVSGDGIGAAAEYEAALRANPDDSFAAGNLALLKASMKQYQAAIGLWERAFAEDPVQLKAGMNLAIVECGLGKKEAALGTLDRILSFSPDDGAARELARGIRSGSHGCGKN